MKTTSKIPPSILALAQQLKAAQEKAAALGLFINDRELLTCPKCGLKEDILISGQLITHERDQPDADDSGLRFHEIDDEHFVCPRCGSTAVFE